MSALKLSKAQMQKAIRQEEADSKAFAQQRRIERAEDHAQSRLDQLCAERTYEGLTQDLYGGPAVQLSDYL
jgi:hypothetical protein